MERQEQYRSYDPGVEWKAFQQQQAEDDARKDAYNRAREVAGHEWPVCTKCGRDELRTDKLHRIFSKCQYCGGEWSR